MDICHKIRAVTYKSVRALVLTSAIATLGWPAFSYATLMKIGPTISTHDFSVQSGEIATAGRGGGEMAMRLDQLLQRGDHAGLLRTAAQILEVYPNSGLGLEIKGTAHFLRNEFDKAIASFIAATRHEADQSGPWTKLGILQLNTGSVEGGIASLRKALQINAQDRIAHQWLGLALDHQGKPAEAITHLSAGLEGMPLGHRGVAMVLARLFNEANRPREAITVLEPRLPLEAEDGHTHRILATSYYAAKQYTQAAERYARAMVTGADSRETRLGQAMAIRGGGDYAKAAMLFEGLIKEHSDWPFLQYQYGLLLLVQDRVLAARQAFNQAIQLGLSRHVVDEAMGRYSIKAGKPGEAVLLFESVLAAQPERQQLYAELSELYLAVGDVDAGEAALRRGLKQHPDSVFLHLRLASYLASVKKYAEALPVINVAARQTPDDPLVLRTRSLIRSRLGDTVGAIADARKLYELAGESAPTGVFYAVQLEAGNKQQEAVRVYRRVIEDSPDNALALNNLASLLVKAGQLKEAERHARAAHALARDNVQITDTLAWVLHKQGKYREAGDYFKKAQASGTKIAVVDYHHGLNEAALGNKVEARKLLREALGLDADAEWSDNARKVLEHQ